MLYNPIHFPISFLSVASIPSSQMTVQIFRHLRPSASSDLLDDFYRKPFVPFYENVFPLAFDLADGVRARQTQAFDTLIL